VGEYALGHELELQLGWLLITQVIPLQQVDMAVSGAMVVVKLVCDVLPHFLEGRNFCTGRPLPTAILARVVGRIRWRFKGLRPPAMNLQKTDPQKVILNNCRFFSAYIHRNAPLPPHLGLITGSWPQYTPPNREIIALVFV
jgi:hypothetical protein